MFGFDGIVDVNTNVNVNEGLTESEEVTFLGSDNRSMPQLQLDIRKQDNEYLEYSTIARRLFVSVSEDASQNFRSVLSSFGEVMRS